MESSNAQTMSLLPLACPAVGAARARDGYPGPSTTCTRALGKWTFQTEANSGIAAGGLGND